MSHVHELVSSECLATAARMFLSLTPKAAECQFLSTSFWNVPRGHKPELKDLDPEVGRQRGLETLGKEHVS